MNALFYKKGKFDKKNKIIPFVPETISIDASSFS